MVDREELLSRQKALGDFGEFVLDNDDLQKILDEACRIVAEALKADFAKIVQIDRKSRNGLIRAGVGWKPGIVGHERIEIGERSSEAYAIKTTEPVVTQDIEAEDRFEFPRFMREHGVAAIVNVPILLPGREPWGLLEVDSKEPRDFGQEDIEFLRTYAMVLGPVIDRLGTVADLAESGERLRLVLENARRFAIVITDTDDRITDWLGDSEAIFGWSAEEMIGQSMDRIFTLEDREAGVPKRELAQARREGCAPDIRWHVTKDGGRVFLDGQAVVLRDTSGAVRGYMKIAQDVTDRARNEERQAVLLAELQHRVRNVLAMVRSLVRRTLDGAVSIEDAGREIEGRLDALARTQALLTRALGIGVDLEGIIKDELEAQSAQEEQVTISGPQIELAPKAAEVVTLVLHELTTNAAKYGALRQEGARLFVGWRVDEEREPPLLRLNWRETGVSIPASGGRRSGFGTELIKRKVPYELKGSGRIEFHVDGVEAEIELPLVEGTSVLQTGEPL
jgi:PAS domain S-box-containing protein